jgi:RES domain-containing protein
MLVYRIGKTKYAKDLSGEGARLNGGRWNHKLVPCTYTSESRALALLEYTVNVNIEDIPRALSITTFEIQDSQIQLLTEADLPGNRRQIPAPSSTKDFGTALLRSLNYSVTGIPSSILPNEYNYLLNPLHPNSRNFKIADIADFAYDVRIKIV